MLLFIPIVHYIVELELKNLVATKDGLLASIRETGALNDETTAELTEAINAVKEKFLNK